MKRNYYALVGHSKMAEGLMLGIGVFAYDPETAAMTHLGDYDRELRVGCQTWDPNKKILYVVDEYWSLPGQTGGGGNVASLQMDPNTGALSRTSLQRTFGTNPSYLTLDKTGNYMLTVHHCTDHFVTRIVKTEAGYVSETQYDLCTVLLYRVEEDGRIGEILDVFEIHGEDRDGAHRFPHLHCVVPDQNRGCYVVCDKGLDRIYTFQIDYDHEKLFKCAQQECKPGSSPRYAAFCPKKPVFYSNCENSIDVNTYRLDTKTGSFYQVGSFQGVPRKEAQDISPSDIVVHPRGNYVFTSLRKRNLISALRVMGDGSLMWIQTIPCGGENPRGLCISPDGRFLLAANIQSACVSIFSIGADGILTPAGQVHTGGFPGNIQIVCMDTDKDQ